MNFYAILAVGLMQLAINVVIASEIKTPVTTIKIPKRKCPVD